jgi:hypothetical protein
MAPLRIGIYSSHGSFPPAIALGRGFASVGYTVSHRSLSDFGANDRESIFTLVAVFGLRGKGKVILDEYERAGVPVLVLDFGYLKRDEYWQLSLGGLNRIPVFPCSDDRFVALGLPMQAMRDGDGPAVLAGQLIGDQAHPFDTEKKWNAFVSQFPDIEYRAHPLMGEEAPKESVAELLARAGKIVTWNSNLGNEAWLAGVWVEAHAPDAMYKDVTPDNRHEYFARLAYGQWTVEEMSEGSAARFVTLHLLTGTPPEAVEALPVLTEEAPLPSPPEPSKPAFRRGRR